MTLPASEYLVLVATVSGFVVVVPPDKAAGGDERSSSEQPTGSRTRSGRSLPADREGLNANVLDGDEGLG